MLISCRVTCFYRSKMNDSEDECSWWVSKDLSSATEWLKTSSQLNRAGWWCMCLVDFPILQRCFTFEKNGCHKEIWKGIRRRGQILLYIVSFEKQVRIMHDTRRRFSRIIVSFGQTISFV